MNTLFVVLGFAGIAALDLPDIIKKKRWRDLAVYSVIFAMVLTLGVLVASGVKVPSPIKAIQAFYRDVIGLSFKAS